MKAFKRVFSIFMALILLLLPLASCDTPNAGDDTTVNDETTTLEETTTGDAPITQPTYATESFKITSETPLDEVIKLVEEYKSVPIVELPKLDVDLSLFIPQNYDCTESNSPIHLHRYADFMPIWYVKKLMMIIYTLSIAFLMKATRKPTIAIYFLKKVTAIGAYTAKATKFQALEQSHISTMTV